MVFIGRWFPRSRRDHAGQGAGPVDVEDDDRQLVGLAQAERVRIHDRVVLDDRFLERQAGNELRLRVLLRVGRVHPVDVGALEHHVGLHLERRQHAGGVGGEERVARAGCEDDDAALLQCRMARRRMYGSATDSIRIAVMTRVCMPNCSSTPCSASALMTVPSMPM
jgi:hypothetical protein